MKNLLIVCLLLLAKFSFASKVNCGGHRNQAVFRQCISKNVQNVLIKRLNKFGLLGESSARYDIPNFDPLKIEKLTVPKGSSAVEFDQKYEEFIIHGLREAVISNFRVDTNNKTIQFEAVVSNLTITYKFHFSGKLFGEPINLEGIGYEHYYDDTVFKVTTKFEVYKKYDLEYIKAVNTKLLWLPRNVNFRYTSNDEYAAAHLTDIATKNWGAIYTDVQQLYEQNFASIYNQFFDRFLSNVTVTELFGNADLLN